MRVIFLYILLMLVGVVVTQQFHWLETQKLVLIKDGYPKKPVKLRKTKKKVILES